MQHLDLAELDVQGKQMHIMPQVSEQTCTALYPMSGMVAPVVLVRRLPGLRNVP